MFNLTRYSFHCVYIKKPSNKVITFYVVKDYLRTMRLELVICSDVLFSIILSIKTQNNDSNKNVAPSLLNSWYLCKYPKFAQDI